MISVIGSTGKVGGRVAAMLLEAGVPVRALVRSPEKAAPLSSRGSEIVVGSLLNLNDVKSAFDRCDGAFLMTPFNTDVETAVQDEITIGKNYGEALKDSTIKHVVYMSVTMARDNTGIPFFDAKKSIEDSIAASGVDCTFIRPAFFMENFYMQVPAIQQFNMISLPLPADLPVPMVATEDIAYAAVQSVNRGGRGQESFEILGARDYTMAEVTEIISKATGRDIRYREMPYDEAERTFAQFGVSPNVAKDIVTMYKVMRERRVEADRTKIYDEFNFEPTSFETFASTFAGLTARTGVG